VPPVASVCCNGPLPAVDELHHKIATQKNDQLAKQNKKEQEVLSKANEYVFVLDMEVVGVRTRYHLM
jgi:hypothetical protein